MIRVIGGFTVTKTSREVLSQGFVFSLEGLGFQGVGFRVKC